MKITISLPYSGINHVTLAQNEYKWERGDGWYQPPYSDINEDALVQRVLDELGSESWMKNARLVADNVRVVEEHEPDESGMMVSVEGTITVEVDDDELMEALSESAHVSIEGWEV